MSGRVAAATLLLALALAASSSLAQGAAPAPQQPAATQPSEQQPPPADPQQQPAPAPQPATPAPQPSAQAAAPPAPATQAPQQAPAPPPAAAVPVPAQPAPATVPPVPPAAAPAPAGTPPGQPPPPAAQALSRTLVEEGGLLLEPGRFELVPEISYAHSDEDGMLTPEGVVPGQTRRVTGSITLRLGLPLRLQAEGELPLVWARQDATAGDARPAEETGVGDFRAAVTFHAYRGGEPGGAPDVLLNGFWKSRTGRSPLDTPDPATVPLGSGTQQVGGGISLVKAVDPVVLLASVSLGGGIPRRLHAGWLDTGLEVGITTSAVLAVSPETSLSFGLDQSYAGDVKLAGRSLPGTATTAATFDVGFATLASRAGLLQVTLGIGLTADVPRFQVSLGLPLAF